MKIQLAPSLLLSVLCSSNDGVTAFSPGRLAVTSRTSASTASRQQVALSMSNDFDRDHNVDVDRRGNIRNINASELNRRDALARFAAAAAASVAFLGGSNPAFAADKPAPEFSESPTSDSSIARSGYDGKGAPVEEAAADEPAPEAEAAPEAKKSASDFDGNEAGSVGASDEGTQPAVKKTESTLDSVKVALPILDLPNVYSDPKVLAAGGAAVAVLALASLANTADESEEQGSAVTTPAAKAPPAAPYGLSGGRNYWDGVDMNAAKNAGLVANAPPPPQPAAVEEPVEEPEPAALEVPVKKEKWKLDLPTPYGIQNADGKNPFITQVMEYCEGGKVTEPCTETIKGYLDVLADTGAVATSGEVSAIVGYLGSLGSNSPSPGTKTAGAAFTSYLDALSEGSAPPPSSAKAVKTYLDTLKGFESGAAASPIIAAAAPEPIPEPTYEPVAVAANPDFAQYDNRLTNIETRVTSLETKVDQLPDQVFEKIEAWQTTQAERMTEEVKKIVNALTPPPALPTEPVIVEAPAPVAPVPAPIPEPVAVVMPEPQSVVPATPLAGVIPPRFGVPQAGDSAGPKKGYGFGGGGGASWKNGNPSSSGGGYLDNMSP